MSGNMLTETIRACGFQRVPETTAPESNSGSSFAQSSAERPTPMPGVLQAQPIDLEQRPRPVLIQQ